MKTILRRFDETVALPIGKIPASLQVASRWIGRFTSPVMWIVYLLGVYAVWLTPQYLPMPVLLAVLSMPLATFMKYFFRRKRPPTIYAEAMKIKSYSFPSSHAFSATVGAGLLAFQAFHSGLPGVGFALALVPIVVGLSRVHLGAHYPSDVCAGWLLGLVVLLTVAGRL